MNPPATLAWQGTHLALLDQRRLPDEVTYLACRSVDDVVEAIRSLAVRGAPAIGIAAAYGMALAEQTGESSAAAAERLVAARPTAVNLAWAVDQVRAGMERGRAAIDTALEIHADDIAMCRAIGEAGRQLIEPGCHVLTHCNAGALAVSALGTATAPLYLAHADGVPFHVYVDETRPVLQGARLTAWELGIAGIDRTLICDNAAAHLMGQGAVDLVIVGTDRITANGDVVNKIGTRGLAILADYHNVPFYVACPTSTFDPVTRAGSDVPIEERSAAEILEPIGLSGDIPVKNPAFDVTPEELVTGYITDRGFSTSVAIFDSVTDSS